MSDLRRIKSSNAAGSFADFKTKVKLINKFRTYTSVYMHIYIAYLVLRQFIAQLYCN